MAAASGGSQRNSTRSDRNVLLHVGHTGASCNNVRLYSGFYAPRNLRGLRFLHSSQRLDLATHYNDTPCQLKDGVKIGLKAGPARRAHGYWTSVHLRNDPQPGPTFSVTTLAGCRFGSVIWCPPLARDIRRQIAISGLGPYCRSVRSYQFKTN